MARPLREDRDGDEDGGVNERMCIVTRQGGTPETLIRFVAGPDGSVVPDLKRVLPGRGCWVTAERELVDKSVGEEGFVFGVMAEG